MQTGQKIASLRKKAGLSQEELAEKLFVSRELVSKWETGKRNPCKEMTVRLSELFNVPVENLYDSKNNSCDELLKKQKFRLLMPMLKILFFKQYKRHLRQ